MQEKAGSYRKTSGKAFISSRSGSSLDRGVSGRRVYRTRRGSGSCRRPRTRFREATCCRPAPTLFSCGLQGSAASRPRGAPSGGRSLQDLAFLLPYRFRDAKIRTREPARLMPNPCDIFRGGPVRRSPASPRARESPRSTKRGILDKIASYFVQSPTFPPCRSSKPFLGLAKWPYFKKGNTETIFVLPFNILKTEF